MIDKVPIIDFLWATSVGVLAGGETVLDLDYKEDFGADVDMNSVMTGSGEFVEIQGSGEEARFSNVQLQSMLSLAEPGLSEIGSVLKEVIGTVVDRNGESKT